VDPALIVSTYSAAADHLNGLPFWHHFGRRIHADAGLPAPEVFVERWRMPLAAPDDFWPVILGTSNRGVYDALAPAARARVEESVLARLERERVDGLDMEALIAIARTDTGASTGCASM
jgi:hypothetical protein